MGKISNWDDRIDSRDVLARIDELEAAKAAWEADSTMEGSWEADEPDEAEELDLLVKLVSDMRQIGGDTPEDGVFLVRESNFEAYAQELAEETSEIDFGSLQWPLTCIDWEQAARELQMDYTSVEFDGVTYYGQ